MTLYRRIFAVLAWITLGVQYGLFLKALTVAAILERTVEYVSYFTIVTNFLIAFAFTVPVLAPESRAGRWWAAASPRGATTVFAVVVMIIYHLLLRSLWEPKGLQLANDYMLHYVMPIAILVDWLAFTPRGGLRWRDAVTWLVVPTLYGAWTLLHGAVSGFYPYPFMDVAELGYPGVLLNMVGLLLGFLVPGLLLVALDGLLARKQPRTT
jgi:hypothetical protein